MNNEGRYGDAQALRHVCRCEFEASGRDERSLNRWSIGMGNRELQHCYQTSFKI